MHLWEPLKTSGVAVIICVVWLFVKPNDNTPPRLPEQATFFLMEPNRGRVAANFEIENDLEETTLSLHVDFNPKGDTMPKSINWEILLSGAGIGELHGSEGVKVGKPPPVGVPATGFSNVARGSIHAGENDSIYIDMRWNSQGGGGPVIKSGPYLAVALPKIAGREESEIEVGRVLRMKGLRPYVIYAGPQPTQITSTLYTEEDEWIWEDEGRRNLPPVSSAVNIAESQEESAKVALARALSVASIATAIAAVVEFCVYAFQKKWSSSPPAAEDASPGAGHRTASGADADSG
ncbi:hypothetical protein [Streptomyces javensis]|uniref:Uncharacterized protein n=1 Tax=Streptomyces javensis TaxID=114698 RepID=A0ABP4I6D5_9ACTN